jgi:WD40 repeat protein
LKLTKDLIISGSEDASIKIWSARSGECLQTLKGHQAAVVCLQLDEAHQQLISGSADHTVKVWDLHSGHSLYTLKHHSSPIWNIHVSPTQLITSAMDRSLLIHDFTTQILSESSTSQKITLTSTGSADILY